VDVLSDAGEEPYDDEDFLEFVVGGDEDGSSEGGTEEVPDSDSAVDDSDEDETEA
jgi:hypothetical protein